MSDFNILEPLIVSIFEVGNTILDIVLKRDKFDFKHFFEVVNLKNSSGEKPILLDSFKNKDMLSYIFSIPPGLTLNDFLKYKEAIEQQFNSPVEIKYKDKRIIINVILIKLETSYPYLLPTSTDKKLFRIPIGNSIKGIEYIYPQEIPHTLIAGTTGSGKSICTKSILTSVLNMYGSSEAEIYLIDFKLVELNLFKECKQVKAFVYEIDEVVKLISDLLEECKRRYKLFQEANVTNLTEYNAKYPNKKLKHQFIFIEEFVMLSEEKKGMKMLRKLASLSRASSQFIFLSCQRPDNTVIDNVFKANVGNRICFRTEDNKNSIVILDKEGAKDLKGKGHGIFKSGATDIEIQAYNLENNFLIDNISKFKVVASPGAINNKICKSKNALAKKDISTKTININSSTTKITDLSFLDKL